MELINKNINNELILLLEKLSNDIFDIISNDIDKKKIGYYNIYHNKWSDKNIKYIDIVDKIINEINSSKPSENIKLNKILYIGFIYSFPNCESQTFHYDYSNKTETFFIPLSNLSDLNGTEFLAFNNVENYENTFTLLNKINNKFSLKGYIQKYLLDNNIYDTEYEFKIYNTNKYSLYKLPKNVFHRGKTNETDTKRILLQVVTIDDLSYVKNILFSDIIINAELDDNNSLSDFNKEYLLKFNDKYLSLSKRGKNYSYSNINYTANYENNKLNNFKWKIKIINNLIYICHFSGVFLYLLDYSNSEPFHFSVNYNEKYYLQMSNNNTLSFTPNIKLVFIEIV